MRTKLLALLVVPAITACTQTGSEVVGPCVHRYVGPVLEIERATHAGRAVHHVEILSVRESHQSFDIVAAARSGESTGLAVDRRGHVRCALPCAFGEVPGRWRVRVAGPDGSTGAVDTRARYHDGGGNCPSYSSDGSEVAMVLR